MNDQPNYVCAHTARHAEDFIRSDLREDPRRLRFIDSPDQLRGLRDALLYVHPTARFHKSYDLIMQIAELQGCIFARIDDLYARRLHNS